MSIVVMDRGGGIVIPKLLREKLGLKPGDKLALDAESEPITLRPLRVKSRTSDDQSPARKIRKER